ncbi:MAG: tetratricopeptide repeat protein [Pseudomonadota bacterium]
MRINKKTTFALALAFVWTAGSSVAQADEVAQQTRSFDPTAPVIERPSAADALAPHSEYTKDLAEDLFIRAASAYFDGDYGTALATFEKAAESGHPLAQWKLGRMYQEGDGVGANPAEAFRYFKMVAASGNDILPYSETAPFVAHSLVSIGEYYLTGLEEIDLPKDPAKALKIFRHAASLFGNADAQFNLGRMYFDGTAGRRDKHMAARWLKLAALKGHHKSQALLGRMMFLGDGIPQRPSEGLMWLTLAREQAKGMEDDWIRTDQERAFALATETERRSAMARAGQWATVFADR